MIRTVGIVSLSSGILGEPFVQHEVRLGLARLQDYGLQVRFLPHARAGLEALRAHPEWRAEDLLQAFRDPEIDLILCAIGGDDTYRLAPYLFETGELQRAVTQKPFLGFPTPRSTISCSARSGCRRFTGRRSSRTSASWTGRCCPTPGSILRSC